MSIVLKIISILICLLIIYGLCREMKRKKLSENQAMLWLAGAFGLLILSVFPEILTKVAGLLGIWWAPAALIFFLLIVIILIILRNTITISEMETEIKELAMQIALLKNENEELQTKLGNQNNGEQAKGMGKV